MPPKTQLLPLVELFISARRPMRLFHCGVWCCTVHCGRPSAHGEFLHSTVLFIVVNDMLLHVCETIEVNCAFVYLQAIMTIMLAICIHDCS